MSEYHYRKIEKKWQKYWDSHQTFQAEETSGKPKYYILDMFPYPSGEGLHVGHPLGYIASDIYSRYKRHKGYEVLHPMGFDAYGLPAEQYAIETGQHPAVTTEKNINRYRNQLKMLGLSFDWNREVQTCDPDYYKWTQWLFLKFFRSWYNRRTDKAEPISTLVEEFNNNGNAGIDAAGGPGRIFTAEEWGKMVHDEKEEILLTYRLAYLSESEVNWCPALGTVLANDEVQNGLSVRGGHPVQRKKMKQWFLRISAYADRLLEGLDRIDWPESLKEIQRNWIGKSTGAEIRFDVENSDKKIHVFTTRPDTLFGSTFMVLAPEHELVKEITTPGQKQEVENYIREARQKSERERKADVKNISGVFTGAYAINPFSKEKTPVWIADYVLADYGTGAIMAVPGHDSRDHAFAKFYDLQIKEVVEGGNISEEAYAGKDGILVNSGFLNGLEVNSAIVRAIQELEKMGIGNEKINYKLRDAGFSRQRYWGEPFPMVYENEVPIPVSQEELPVKLPDTKNFRPSEEGESPLARIRDWVVLDNGRYRETDTMPGNAGSSWYFLRYMDPQNKNEFVSPEKENYWQNVDFYVGGAEHATGHLMYARFWQKLLFDLGLVTRDEPFQKMINQGMIQGISALVYRIKNSNTFVSKNLAGDHETTGIHVDVSLVNPSTDELNIEKFRRWRSDFENAEFILENGKYFVGRAVEKMSKSLYNVVNPDFIIEEYGCDTFRMYEMFLGPVEQSKPWDTSGIEGVFKFIRRFWNLFFDRDGKWIITSEKPTDEELKVLHKTIQRVTNDIEKFSLNTCISHFMICTNELTKLNCNKEEILKPLVILLEPFAPHLAEELWELFGNKESISKASYPEYDEKYLKEDVFEYPVSVNGKLRAKQEFPLDKDKREIESEVMEIPGIKKWTEGKEVRKFIFVPGRIINIVVS